MKQRILFARRCRKELRRDLSFTVFCLGVPAFLLIFSRLAVHYFAPSAFSLSLLLVGAVIFSQASLCLSIANLVACDKKDAYLIKLRFLSLPPRAAFGGYMLAGLLVSFLQFFICFFVSLFLSLFGEASLSLSAFFPALFAQIPSLLFFVAIGVFVGILFKKRAARGVCILFILLSVLGCGIYFPLSAFGNVGEVLHFLPCACTAQACEAFFANAQTFETFRFPLLLNCLYAFLAAILAFAAFRKKYLR
ncbi:MAG: hypothetical protein J6V82_02475 [Clostridia bacterium]|nr:hypothetical protein [Clostridia bacterium]